VVVGDYNHFFDSTALLHGLALANAWRVGVLVDEAHNLVDRARACTPAASNRRSYGGCGRRRRSG
jgi:DNA excision repair protein ERCC-2